MEGAVKWCIAQGILRDFFEEHGTEVVNMLMAEWKLEDALVVEREEGREEGREKGWKERGERDREETIRNLLDFGMKAEQISRALKLPVDTVQRYFP
jgi:predicted transposase YdaD